jgi:hypothetical protein
LTKNPFFIKSANQLFFSNQVITPSLTIVNPFSSPEIKISFSFPSDIISHLVSSHLPLSIQYPCKEEKRKIKKNLSPSKLNLRIMTLVYNPFLNLRRRLVNNVTQCILFKKATTNGNHHS